MKKILFTIGMILIFSLAGCKKEEVVYNQEENVREEQNGEVMSGSLPEATGVEDTWTETISVDLGMIDTIEIDATVNMPDVESVKVLSASKKEFNEDEKKQIIEYLSEGEVYSYMTEELPKSIWADYIDNVNKVIEEIGNEEGLSDEDREQILELQYEYLADYNENYENAPEDWIAVGDDYQRTSYKIVFKDTDCIVYFLQDEEYQHGYFSVNPIEYTALYPEIENISFVFAETSGEYGTFENECKLTKEQVEKEAIDFVNKMGLGDFSVVSTKDLICYGEDNKSVHNGCEVTLYRNIDGVNVDGGGYDNIGYFHVFSAVEDPLDTYNYEFERITVQINDMGVFSIHYVYPLQLNEIEAENVQILDFKTVKEKLLEVVSTYTYDGMTTRVVKYNNVDFMYYRYKNDESGDFRIVPAWRIAYIPTGSENPERVHFINAIDGSYIDVGKDLYH